MTESKRKQVRTTKASKPSKLAATSRSAKTTAGKRGQGDKGSAAGKSAAVSPTSRRKIEPRPASVDWRAEMLDQVRRLIREADPEIVEERKWIKPTNPLGVPTWSRAGIICTGETYKQVVKLTFAKGASLADPSGLFNSSLDGNTRRAIDIKEGETLDPQAFKALIQAAVAANLPSKRR